MKNELLIAQISDMHIVNKFDPHYSNNRRLKNAIDVINNFKPKIDLIIGTGDLTDNGSNEEYCNLKNILSKAIPNVYLIPGNHDKRENMKKVFSDHFYLQNKKYFCYTIENSLVSLIGLDTLEVGKPGGKLCNERIAWLKEKLEKIKKKPVIIFLHHPPFNCGIWWMDAIGLKGRKKLEKVIKNYNNVEAVLSGHVHRQIQKRWAGTLGYIAPSTAHQIELDLDGNKFLHINNEPTSFSIHHWKKNNGLTSHICYLEKSKSFIKSNIKNIKSFEEYFKKAKQELEDHEKNN